MAVIRRTLSILALLSLLVQAAFGSVSPIAVLCISSHQCDHNGSDQMIVSEAVAGCHQNLCCSQPVHGQDEGKNHTGAADDQGDKERVRVAFATPCDEGCMDCVDVPLPDNLAAQDVRADELVVLTSLAAHAVVHEWPAFQPSISDVLPLRTGPPGVVGCVDRAIIRTTRLLI